MPEAQLDRFLMRVDLGYTTLSNEMRILTAQQLHHPIEALSYVAEIDEIIAMQAIIRQIFVSPLVQRYIVEIVRATREHPEVFLGASPRGSLGLFRASQARAALLGRDYVLPDDVKALAKNVIAHRLVVNPSARLHELSASRIVDEILSKLPIPTDMDAIKSDK